MDGVVRPSQWGAALVCLDTFSAKNKAHEWKDTVYL